MTLRPFRAWFISRDGEVLATEEDVEDLELRADPANARLIFSARLIGRDHLRLLNEACEVEVHLLHSKVTFTRVRLRLSMPTWASFDRVGRSTAFGFSAARATIAWTALLGREELVDLTDVDAMRWRAMCVRVG